MLGGIQLLLGSGVIDSFILGSAPSVVRVTPTEIVQGGQVSIRLSPAVPQGADADPVVVSTGPATGSAGEFATIAFRRRPCTVTMGSATAAVPTGISSRLMQPAGRSGCQNGSQCCQGVLAGHGGHEQKALAARATDLL